MDPTRRDVSSRWRRRFPLDDREDTHIDFWVTETESRTLSVLGPLCSALLCSALPLAARPLPSSRFYPTEREQESPGPFLDLAARTNANAARNRPRLPSAHHSFSTSHRSHHSIQAIQEIETYGSIVDTPDFRRSSQPRCTKNVSRPPIPRVFFG